MAQLSFKIGGNRKRNDSSSQPKLFKAYVVEKFLGCLGKIDCWGSYYAHDPESKTYTLKGFVQFRSIKGDEQQKVILRGFKGTTFRLTKLIDADGINRRKEKQPLLFYPSLGNGALNLLHSDSKQEIKIIRVEGSAQTSLLERPKCSSGASNDGPSFQPTDSRCLPATSRDAPVDLSCRPPQSVVFGASNKWPSHQPRDVRCLPSTSRDAPVDLSCPPQRSVASSDEQPKGVRRLIPRTSTPYSRPSSAMVSDPPLQSSMLRKTRLTSHSTQIVTPLPDRPNSPMPSLIPIEPILSDGEWMANELASASFEAESLIPLPSLLDVASSEESLYSADASSPGKTTSCSASAPDDAPSYSAPTSPPRLTASSSAAFAASQGDTLPPRQTALSSESVEPQADASPPRPAASSSASEKLPTPTAVSSVTTLPPGPNAMPDPKSMPGPSNPTPESASATADASTPGSSNSPLASASSLADTALQETSDAPASSEDGTEVPSNATTGPSQKDPKQRRKRDPNVTVEPPRRSARLMAKAAESAVGVPSMQTAVGIARKTPSQKRKSRPAPRLQLKFFF